MVWPDDWSTSFFFKCFSHFFVCVLICNHSNKNLYVKELALKRLSTVLTTLDKRVNVCLKLSGIAAKQLIPNN